MPQLHHKLLNPKFEIVYIPSQITVDNNLKWYFDQFDNDWKHKRNFEIHTFANPGWALEICLEQTELLNNQFQKVIIDRSEHNWIHCFIRDNVFNGVGGPFNLPEIFPIFRNWVESCEKDNKLKNVKDLDPSELQSILQSFFQIKTSDNHFLWLIEWFYSHCADYYEPIINVLIKAIEPGWYVRIGLEETEFEGIQFPEVYVNRSEDDWIQCFIRKREFIGLGSPFNLMEILQVFRNWSESCAERNFSEEETNE